MTVIELLADLRRLNVELWLEDDRLRYRAPAGALTPALRATLSERKAEVCAFLKTAQHAQQSGAPIPLSSAQRRLWFLDQLEPNSPLYTIPLVVRLRGRLDVGALQQSLDAIVRRHAVLRTTFTIVDGQPTQMIAPVHDGAPLLPLARIDLRHIPAAEQAAALDEEVQAELQRPFDLQRGPLLRATLVCLRAEDDPAGARAEHVMILMIHHIVFDAWSQNVFIGELTQLYIDFSRGTAPVRGSSLPELPLQYSDYARWQHDWLADAGGEQLRYWQRQLRDLPVLQLMTDRPRPPHTTVQGRQYPFVLADGCAAALHRLSQREGCTLFMTLLAAWQVLLARYTQQDDIVVGTPIANRTQAETQPLIGFFVNTLVLRTDLSGDPPFRAALRRVREVALAAYAHQDLPFDTLVDALQPARDPSRHPLFQVLFAYQPALIAPPTVPELALELVPFEIGTVKFDLNLTFTETAAGLAGTLKYRTDLFEERTIAHMVGQLRTLLDAIGADPDVRLSNLPLLTAAERAHLLHGARATASYPITHCLHQAFEQQVAQTPDARAVAYDDTSLTYAALNRRANQLARQLQALGVGPDVAVGLFVARSLDLIVGLLGILKAGGAYLPLDPALPPERIAFMLHDAGAAVLVTQAPLAATLPQPTIPVVRLDADAAMLARHDDAAPASTVMPQHAAYVIYTSGSTGTPKGVVVTHANVLRLFAATDAWFQFNARDVWTLFHSAAFDFSVWEIWGALLYGGTLIVVPYLTSRSPEAVYELLRRDGVTVLNQTPSAFRQLIAVDAAHRASDLQLRLVIFGGEALDLHILQPWVARHGDARPQLVNMYGITETTVHVTYRPLTTADLQHPGSVIGGAIPDLELYVLDRQMQPVPIGVPGELYVGGAGLARGYHNRRDLTAEKFVPNPFGDEDFRLGVADFGLEKTAAPIQNPQSQIHNRLYRTGDLARYRADGELEYLGRIDQQVKIRGFRIETGEIEAVLARHPAVRAAVVIAREDTPGDRRLVAYVVPPPAAEPTVEALREFLSTQLPEYMIPAAFVLLPQLPLTTNGKLDRNALPLPDQARPALETAYTPPRTPLEAFLVERWQALLGLTTVGIHDDFFALGGNSIQAALLVNQLQAALHEIVYVVAVFDAPTIARLAAYLTARYPQGVARIEGAEASAPTSGVAESPASTPARRIGPAEVAQLRRLLPPRPPRESRPGTKNRPAVFILSPPRSGSTLLRVMLGGHPRLFAPPELELLSFATLAERTAAFTGRDRFWLEGTIRAVMALKHCDAATAEQIMAQYEAQGLSVPAFYGQLQTWLGERLLVDKTPSYALDRAILERAEEDFAEARYIHLLRHPSGMIRSFEEARLDQIFFRQSHPFTPRELAELIWLISHQNILDFFAQIPAERRLTLSFEELVRDPHATMQQACTFLGLELDPAMLQPYAERQQRMTDGPHAASRMLGDVKFHEHGRIDPAVSERWREHEADDVLGDVTWQLAERLGYPRPRAVAAVPPPARSTWTPIVPQPRVEDAAFPCSFAQQRLWFIDQLQPGSAAYNIFAALRLTGHLDRPALQRTLDTIVARHEVLRTVFAVVDSSPVQVIAAPQPVAITTIDLRALPEAERLAAARQRATAEAQAPFDLARGPLLRVLLLQLAADDSVLVLNTHHIVSDGWSQRVLLEELTALYAAYRADLSAHAILPPLPIQYADVAVWQQQWLTDAELAAQVAYWQQQLADLPVLDLPTDHPRPAIPSGKGRHQQVLVPATLSEALAGLARQEGVTLFMVLLAAFQTMLARYTGQPDIVVGTPIAGRNRAELEGLIGLFVNTLVIRTDLSGNPTFREALQRVRHVTAAAYAHQDVPFEHLVERLVRERELSRHPLFQIMFTLQNAPLPGVAAADLTWSALEIEGGTAKLDLTLALVETPQGVQGAWEYSTDLFDDATIARMAAHFLTLLQSIVTQPAARIGSLELLSAAERRRMLVTWNATAAAYPADQCFHTLVAAQAARTPDAVAVVDAATQLTYGDLQTRANQLARYLHGRGIGGRAQGEVRVGLCMERSAELVIALLGILQAGGVYVPLDPTYPQERLAFMLADAEVPLVLTQQRLRERLPETGAQIVALDAEWGRIGQACAEALENPVTPDNLAYIIYTSGSTGQPKGAMITHRGLVNYLHWCTQAYRLAEGCGTPVHSSIGFDLTVTSLCAPLIVGQRVLLLPDDQGLDALSAALRPDAQLSLVKLTPSHIELLNHTLPAETLANRAQALIIGGEALRAETIARWREYAPATRLINEYGPTETVVGCCVYEVPPAGALPALLPIGRPIANTQLYILDRQMQPVPIGVAGELYIGGLGVARGYHNRPALTAETFVPNPFVDVGLGNDSDPIQHPTSQIQHRLYRTGDLVRYRADGEIEFLGRIDDQIKLRGYRIELGEIEAALLRQPGVEAAAVVARAAGSQATQLIAYVVAQPQDAVTSQALRGALAQFLPPYMLPTAIVLLEALPLTTHGKVDRRALPALDESQPRPSSTFVAPRSSAEWQMARLWEAVLGRHRVGVTENFFELGGHSLLSVRLLAQIHQQFGVSLPLTTLFQAPTIEQLVVALSQQPSGGHWSALVPLQAAGEGQPFFCVHPVGGGVLCYAELARQLGPARPIYGLQAWGLESGQHPYDDLPTMARRYLAEIRQIQPEGPYLLGGWSLGGVVAFELARQLRQLGQEVALLALIDSVLPGARVAAPEDAALVVQLAHDLALMYGQTLAIEPDEVRALSPREQLAYVLDQARQRGVVPPDADLEYIHRLAAVFQANLRATGRYTPAPLPQRIALLQAADRLHGVGGRDLAAGWQSVAEELDVAVVTGDHYTIMRPPYVEAVAEWLRDRLARSV